MKRTMNWECIHSICAMSIDRRIITYADRIKYSPHSYSYVHCTVHQFKIKIKHAISFVVCACIFRLFFDFPNRPSVFQFMSYKIIPCIELGFFHSCFVSFFIIRVLLDLNFSFPLCILLALLLSSAYYQPYFYRFYSLVIFKNGLDLRLSFNTLSASNPTPTRHLYWAIDLVYYIYHNIHTTLSISIFLSLSISSLSKFSYLTFSSCDRTTWFMSLHIFYQFLFE